LYVLPAVLQRFPTVSFG